MREIRATEMTDKQWNRLVSKTGLKQEDWGEAWLALNSLGPTDEETAVSLLRRNARTAATGRQLRIRLASTL